METKELLERALSEINSLRRQNEFMAARLDMFDAVMSALHGKPALHEGGFMHPDISREIKSHLDALKGVTATTDVPDRVFTPGKK